MASIRFSTKRLQIDKANAKMLTILALTSFVVIFSLMASKALLNQRAYQSRVIAEKEKAKAQLQENIKAASSLTDSYGRFISAPENILGGNPKGQNKMDGDNAKLVLDALPSKYDFPALTSSLDKILNSTTYKLESITGIDDEVNQQAKSSSPAPVVIDIPFQAAVSGSYTAMQNLIMVLEKSIRPIRIDTINLTGTDNAMSVTINAKTFYQPEKNLSITTKIVK